MVKSDMVKRDKISLYDMQFWAYHGVFAEEKALGQRFHIDTTLEIDLTQAGQMDLLAASVSYADVYNAVQSVTTGERYDLLEALCYRLIQAILEVDSRILSAEVCIKKPQAPIPGHYGYPSVTMKRERSDF